MARYIVDNGNGTFSLKGTWITLVRDMAAYRIKDTGILVVPTYPEEDVDMFRAIYEGHVICDHAEAKTLEEKVREYRREVGVRSTAVYR